MEIVVFAKPLVVAHQRIEQIKDFLNQFNAQVKEIKTVTVTLPQIESHYAEHSGKPFFPKLTSYYNGKTIVVFKVEVNSTEDIAAIRTAMGKSSIEEGSFRHDLVYDIYDTWTLEHGPFDNGIHASDSVEAGNREVSIWF